MRILIIAACVLCLSIVSFSQNTVRLSDISNLTYQLDCVSNQRIPCSGRNLGELWKREFLKSEKDILMLKEWGKLRKFNSKYINLSKEQGNRRASLNLFEKIRIAGLQANSVSDYLARMDLLTPPQQRAGFERVVRHFYPRFKLWWDKEILEKGGTFRAEIKRILDSEKVSRKIKQFVKFYSPSLNSNYDTSFNLIYIPSTVKESTNGQQIENYSLIEFKIGEEPLQRIDVVIHELCHFYYKNISHESAKKLADSFRSVDSPLSTPAYNLLNEALASAFGNGMIVRELVSKERYERYNARKNSFYNNDAIDKTGKALIPLLDKYIADKRNLHDSSFAKEYISEVEKTFTKDEIKPRLYLSTMSLVVDGDFGEYPLSSVVRAMRSGSVYNSQGDLRSKEMAGAIGQTQNRNSIFIVKPKNLEMLVKYGVLARSEVEKILLSFKQDQIVLFNKQRQNYINAYIIVAEKKDASMLAVKFLANTPQFVGLNKGLNK